MNRINFDFQKNEYSQLVSITDKFYPLSNLLFRLLDVLYNNKKLEFINFNFYTDEVFEYISKNRGIDIRYGIDWNKTIIGFYDVFDFTTFEAKNYNDQKIYLWEKCHYILSFIANQKQANDLKQAIDEAYKIGLDMNLETNYIMLSQKIELNNRVIIAEIWVKFTEFKMEYIFVLNENNSIVFEKTLNIADVSTKHLFVKYKKITIDEQNSIVIKQEATTPIKFSVANVLN